MPRRPSSSQPAAAEAEADATHTSPPRRGGGRSSGNAPLLLADSSSPATNTSITNYSSTAATPQQRLLRSPPSPAAVAPPSLRSEEDGGGGGLLSPIPFAVLRPTVPYQEGDRGDAAAGSVDVTPTIVVSDDGTAGHANNAVDSDAQRNISITSSSGKPPNGSVGGAANNNLRQTVPADVLLQQQQQLVVPNNKNNGNSRHYNNNNAPTEVGGVTQILSAVPEFEAHHTHLPPPTILNTPTPLKIIYHICQSLTLVGCVLLTFIVTIFETDSYKIKYFLIQQTSQSSVPPNNSSAHAVAVVAFVGLCIAFTAMFISLQLTLVSPRAQGRRAAFLNFIAAALFLGAFCVVAQQTSSTNKLITSAGSPDPLAPPPNTYNAAPGFYLTVAAFAISLVSGILGYFLVGKRTIAGLRPLYRRVDEREVVEACNNPEALINQLISPADPNYHRGAGFGEDGDGSEYTYATASDDDGDCSDASSATSYDDDEEEDPRLPSTKAANNRNGGAQQPLLGGCDGADSLAGGGGGASSSHYSIGGGGYGGAQSTSQYSAALTSNSKHGNQQRPVNHSHHHLIVIQRRYNNANANGSNAGVGGTDAGGNSNSLMASTQSQSYLKNPLLNAKKAAIAASLGIISSDTVGAGVLSSVASRPVSTIQLQSHSIRAAIAEAEWGGANSSNNNARGGGGAFGGGMGGKKRGGNTHTNTTTSASTSSSAALSGSPWMSPNSQHNQHRHNYYYYCQQQQNHNNNKTSIAGDPTTNGAAAAYNNNNFQNDMPSFAAASSSVMMSGVGVGVGEQQQGKKKRMKRVKRQPAADQQQQGLCQSKPPASPMGYYSAPAIGGGCGYIDDEDDDSYGGGGGSFNTNTHKSDAAGSSSYNPAASLSYFYGRGGGGGDPNSPQSPYTATYNAKTQRDLLLMSKRGMKAALAFTPAPKRAAANKQHANNGLLSASNSNYPSKRVYGSTDYSSTAGAGAAEDKYDSSTVIPVMMTSPTAVPQQHHQYRDSGFESMQLLSDNVGGASVVAVGTSTSAGVVGGRDDENHLSPNEPNPSTPPVDAVDAAKGNSAGSTATTAVATAGSVGGDIDPLALTANTVVMQQQQLLYRNGSAQSMLSANTATGNGGKKTMVTSSPQKEQLPHSAAAATAGATPGTNSANPSGYSTLRPVFDDDEEDDEDNNTNGQQQQLVVDGKATTSTSATNLVLSSPTVMTSATATATASLCYTSATNVYLNSSSRPHQHHQHAISMSNTVATGGESVGDLYGSGGATSLGVGVGSVGLVDVAALLTMNASNANPATASEATTSATRLLQLQQQQQGHGAGAAAAGSSKSQHNHTNNHNDSIITNDTHDDVFHNSSFNAVRMSDLRGYGRPVDDSKPPIGLLGGGHQQPPIATTTTVLTNTSMIGRERGGRALPPVSADAPSIPAHISKPLPPAAAAATMAAVYNQQQQQPRSYHSPLNAMGGGGGLHASNSAKDLMLLSATGNNTHQQQQQPKYFVSRSSDNTSSVSMPIIGGTTTRASDAVAAGGGSSALTPARMGGNGCMLGQANTSGANGGALMYGTTAAVDMIGNGSGVGGGNVRLSNHTNITAAAEQAAAAALAEEKASLLLAPPVVFYEPEPASRCSVIGLSYLLQVTMQIATIIIAAAAISSAQYRRNVVNTPPNGDNGGNDNPDYLPGFPAAFVEGWHFYWASEDQSPYDLTAEASANGGWFMTHRQGQQVSGNTTTTQHHNSAIILHNDDDDHQHLTAIHDDWDSGDDNTIPITYTCGPFADSFKKAAVLTAVGTGLQAITTFITPFLVTSRNGALVPIILQLSVCALLLGNVAPFAGILHPSSSGGDSSDNNGGDTNVTTAPQPFGVVDDETVVVFLQANASSTSGNICANTPAADTFDSLVISRGFIANFILILIGAISIMAGLAHRRTYNRLAQDVYDGVVGPCVDDQGDMEKRLKSAGAYISVEH